jgi:phage virion morphogenesis protein
MSMTDLGQTLTLDRALFDAALTAVIAASQDLAPAFDEIGEMLVRGTRERFALGRAPDGAPWQPSRRARATGGKTLIDTGRLLASIAHEATTDGLGVGSEVIYAAIHQRGGKAGRAALVARPFLGADEDERAAIPRMIAAHVRARIAEARP